VWNFKDFWKNLRLGFWRYRLVLPFLKSRCCRLLLLILFPPQICKKKLLGLYLCWQTLTFFSDGPKFFEPLSDLCLLLWILWCWIPSLCKHCTSRQVQEVCQGRVLFGISLLSWRAPSNSFWFKFFFIFRFSKTRNQNIPPVFLAKV